MAHDEGARAVDLRQRLQVVHHAHGRIGPQADLAGRIRPLAREEGREPVCKVAVVARDVLIAEHRHGVPVVHDLLDGLIAGRRIGGKGDVDGAGRGALRLGQHEVHGEGELPRLQLQRELHAPVLRLAGPVVLPVRLDLGAQCLGRGRGDAKAFARVEREPLLPPGGERLRGHPLRKQRRQVPPGLFFLHVHGNDLLCVFLSMFRCCPAPRSRAPRGWRGSPRGRARAPRSLARAGGSPGRWPC